MSRTQLLVAMSKIKRSQDLKNLNVYGALTTK